jgi:molecular chaperone GrpE
MSNENNSDEIPVEVISNDDNNTIIESIESTDNNIALDEIKILLEKEKEKSEDLENKLKHVLADFQNLNKKKQIEVENGINTKLNQFISNNEENTKGLDYILNNMDSLLEKNNVIPIDALGEIFDPNLHEAISITIDPKLDESTITKEIRKGYISHNSVIRPTLVEISKKQGEN